MDRDPGLVDSRRGLSGTSRSRQLVDSSTPDPRSPDGVFFCFAASRDIKAETAGFSGLSRTTASVTGRNKSTTSNMSMLLPAFSSSEKESATDDSSEKKICTWSGFRLGLGLGSGLGLGYP